MSNRRINFASKGRGMFGPPLVHFSTNNPGFRGLGPRAGPVKLPRIAAQALPRQSKPKK
jgi:hypothetical protein